MTGFVDRIAGVVVVAELVVLGVALWKMVNPDAPELDELVRRYAGDALDRAQYEAAIRQTLASIRRLPETGAE